ncbi:hypothetical protein LUW77_30915 [Streptomyces radiopugnans]|nr:hypothetical protein LUW77_30915 [Streptomyces radiopugnans]
MAAQLNIRILPCLENDEPGPKTGYARADTFHRDAGASPGAMLPLPLFIPTAPSTANTVRSVSTRLEDGRDTEAR